MIENEIKALSDEWGFTQEQLNDIAIAMARCVFDSQLDSSLGLEAKNILESNKYKNIPIIVFINGAIVGAIKIAEGSNADRIEFIARKYLLSQQSIKKVVIVSDKSINFVT